MAYKFKTDVEFIDDVKINGDLEIGHCIIGYPTRAEVTDMINNMGHLKREIVTELPIENIDKDTIYMIQKKQSDSLSFRSWYGGVDENGNWGTEVDATIGSWIKCEVFEEIEY